MFTATLIFVFGLGLFGAWVVCSCLELLESILDARFRRITGR